MIAAVSDGGSSFGLMNYLVGQGRANEHTNPHLVAGSSVIMRRWGSWDELCSAQGYEIAHWVDQFMTETRTRPTGAKRVFNNETGKREVVKDQTPNHVCGTARCRCTPTRGRWRMRRGVRSPTISWT